MRITVVTAVYNSADTVGQAIASVARQSHGDIQHVVIEGGSTDGSLAACQDARHDRMTLISEPDDGIYDALNKGIAHADGDIVGLLHADDFLAHGGVLSKIAAGFSASSVEMVYGDLDYIDPIHTDRIRRHWAAGAFAPAKLRRGWMPPHPTVYLRREVYRRLGGFDPGYRIAGDYDFLLRYLSQCRIPPVYLPEVLVKMRLGGASNGSIARILSKMREDHRALRMAGIGGWGVLAQKSLTKVPQLVTARANRIFTSVN